MKNNKKLDDICMNWTYNDKTQSKGSWQEGEQKPYRMQNAENRETILSLSDRTCIKCKN